MVEADKVGLIYKIVSQDLWEVALSSGTFTGAEIDLQDGYIHFSTGGQLEETVAKHFCGKPRLWIVAVDPRQLGENLRFEASRNNDLFPHLYGELMVGDVEWHHSFRCIKCDVVEQPAACTHKVAK